MRRVCAILCVMAATVTATEIYGPRAMAMGGALVAIVEDGTAAYWNPAALGREDITFSADPVWGFTVADNITECMNEFESFYSNPPSTSNPNELIGFVNDFSDALKRFNDPGTGVIGNMHVGVTSTIGPIAVSWVNMTKMEIGPGMDSQTSRLIDEHYFNDGPDYQRQAMITALRQAGLLTQAEYNRLMLQGWRTTANDMIGLSENKSEIAVSGFSEHDIGVSYAHSFPLGRYDFLSVGGTAKFIYGLRYNNDMGVLTDTGKLDSDVFATGPNWLFNNILGLDAASTGYSFSMDLGVQMMLGRFFHLGIVGHNIIPLDITWSNDALDPTPLDTQIRFGLGFELFDSLTLAMDVDALETEYTVKTRVLVNNAWVEKEIVVDKVRDLSFGVEWMIADIFAIRAGFNTNYNSLIEDQAKATFLASLGFGVQVGDIFHFDLAVMTNQFSAGEHDSTLGASVSLGFAI
ncbi:MAG TPA: conjugal transfer protein TraF [bacterium]|nr:conjugal transfer protein TraF [bacterium]